MLTAPAVGESGDVADIAVQVYVVFITPDGLTAGLIDVVNFKDNARISWDLSDPPTGRQMPYHNSPWSPTQYGQRDWPPTILPQLENAFDASGTLVTGLSPNPLLAPVFFEPNGFLDFIVVRIGTSSPGSILTISVEN
jgi:hypothetical protein